MGRRPVNGKAMTAAERAKRYRQGPNKESIRKSDATRKQKCRLEIKKQKVKYQAFLKRDRMRKANVRSKALVAKKDLQSSTPKQMVSESSISECDISSISNIQTSFSTKQALYRSVKKTENALPVSPRKKMAVLSKMLEKLSPSKRRAIIVTAKNPALSQINHISCDLGRPVTLDSEKRNFLLQFLERQDISYTAPGKKDQVYMGKDEEGNSVFKPKRYLLHPIRELCSMQNDDKTQFDETYVKKFSAKLSYSTLCRFIKGHKHLLFASDVPQTSCLCDKCENLELLVHAITQIPNFAHLPKDARGILLQFSCSLFNEECANGQCMVCPSPDLIELHHIEEISYYQWKVPVCGEGDRKSRYPQKTFSISSGTETIALLMKLIGEMKVHFYVKLIQAKEYQSMRRNVKNNEIIIHVDFSENYNNKQQHAIQSSYFGYKSFSLYTVVVFYSSNSEQNFYNYVLVTESCEHSFEVVFKLNNCLLDLLQKAGHTLEVVQFWSDGCAAQFRSRNCFKLLTKFPSSLQIMWHYFESHHGKGAVDSLGGCVKNTVYRRVLANQIVINSPKQFATYADSLLPSINVVYIDDLNISADFDDEEPVPAIPGTLRVHCVKRDVISASHTNLLFF